jgi:hypothetical protein
MLEMNAMKKAADELIVPAESVEPTLADGDRF